jgi:N-acetylmuramoyl-L-alanine amidase CwlA
MSIWLIFGFIKHLVSHYKLNFKKMPKKITSAPAPKTPVSKKASTSKSTSKASTSKASTSKASTSKVSVSKASVSKASTSNIEASESNLPPVPKKTFTTKKNTEIHATDIKDFDLEEYKTSA